MNHIGKAVVTEHVYVTGYPEVSDAVAEALNGQSC